MLLVCLRVGVVQREPELHLRRVPTPLDLIAERPKRWSPQLGGSSRISWRRKSAKDAATYCCYLPAGVLTALQRLVAVFRVSTCVLWVLWVGFRGGACQFAKRISPRDPADPAQGRDGCDMERLVRDAIDLVRPTPQAVEQTRGKRETRGRMCRRGVRTALGCR